MENISSIIRNKTKVLILASIIPHSFGGNSHTNQREREKNIYMYEIQIRKEKVKLSLFADNIILYIEDFKGATRKLLVINL